MKSLLVMPVKVNTRLLPLLPVATRVVPEPLTFTVIVPSPLTAFPAAKAAGAVARIPPKTEEITKTTSSDRSRRLAARRPLDGVDIPFAPLFP
jgi:hypothetical protein